MKSLKNLNTFGLNVKAESFKSVTSVDELQNLLATTKLPIRILGGGSNILILNDLSGLTIKMDIPGIQIEREFKKSVYLSAGAGVNWHELVRHTVRQNLGGLENLSLIPGTVGASPIQNIGAYGVELKDVFHKLEAVEVKTGKIKIFKKSDCDFGYRNSVFKNKLKGKFVITKVWFKLSKSPHRINKNYGAIQSVLNAKKITQPTILDISDAVIEIRSSKLPDPKKIGNAGSFFKNPVISKTAFAKIQRQYPNLPHYPQSDGRIKLPAGWLIEQCGWKGKKVGHTGTHVNQALVLVNYGKATGKAIFQLAQDIQESVRQNFKIKLEMEVNLWA